MVTFGVIAKGNLLPKLKFKFANGGKIEKSFNHPRSLVHNAYPTKPFSGRSNLVRQYLEGVNLLIV
jgi:hypothetical protein